MSEQKADEKPQIDWYRKLLPGQRCVVNIGFADGREPIEIFSTMQMLFEAPNWHGGSNRLVLNGDGRLWWLDTEPDSKPMAIDAEGLPGVNNDHVLANDGKTIFASANDGHIYEVDLENPAIVRRVTQPDQHIALHFMHFLHGVSTDGKTLVFTGLGWNEPPSLAAPIAVNEIFTVPVEGGPSTQITDSIGGIDGPEYTPDGFGIYVNTEHFSGERGNAQIARMRTSGGQMDQLTFDENVNWFPHFAPAGNRALYLSFAPGTKGHPANQHVAIKVVEGDWKNPVNEIEFFGGQGSINVNSWSPDGERFAFVSYPIDGQLAE